MLESDTGNLYSLTKMIKVSSTTSSSDPRSVSTGGKKKFMIDVD